MQIGSATLVVLVDNFGSRLAVRAMAIKDKDELVADISNVDWRNSEISGDKVKGEPLTRSS